MMVANQPEIKMISRSLDSDKPLDATVMLHYEITSSLDSLAEVTNLQGLTPVGSSFRCSVAKPWYAEEVELARRHVEKLFRNSVLEDRTGLLPKFTQDECSLGKFLGKGSFGTVHEIKDFDINTNTSSKSVVVAIQAQENSLVETEMEGREFIAKHSRRATGESRYAIKCLNLDIMEDRSLYCQGVSNMAIGMSSACLWKRFDCFMCLIYVLAAFTEARLLSAVEHPNIIKLRAVATCGVYQQPGFFLIMDRLYDTLDKRLIKWQSRNRRVSSLFNVLDRKGKKKLSLLEERLVAAFDLSAALEYLHEHR